MFGQAKFNEYIKKRPPMRRSFFDRPHWTRRRFFEVLGAGVTGSYLVSTAKADGVGNAVTPINKAKNVIFILLTGAPSHTDTFDLKEISGTTPADFAPATVNGLRWPTGLLPKLASNVPDMAIVRSMRSWALVHTLSQTWTQIGRNPAAALGDIAPNIGSVVALEKDKERQVGQVFPAFLALNSPGGVGSGFLPSKYSPFKTVPSTTGLADTTNPDGQSRFNDRWSLLHTLDSGLRINSPLGKPVEDMDGFYTAAQDLMYNDVVTKAFTFTADDSTRYGGNSFGNSCLIAKQVLAANQGTRFIQITQGGWDMHQDIYDKQANPKGNLYVLSKLLDDGVSAMLNDLKSSGLLDSTLVVMVGEFGRTTGALNAGKGRDHYPQQFCMFAGGGVKGGRAIGSSDATGSATVDPGWSQQRDVKPEDVEATIYSALGIDWTYVNYTDPFHRGFEYVPGGANTIYAPINELWQS